MLTTDLLSKFAKATNDKTENKTETILYGTIRANEGGTVSEVLLDGAPTPSPINKTVLVSNGDRVTCVIKNNQIIVTGNISDNPIRDIDATHISQRELETKIDADVVEATYATIANLNVANAAIENLRSSIISAETLNATYATIVNLDVANAAIENLRTSKIDAATVQSTYATIVNLNATNAAIENLRSSIISTETLNATYATTVNLNAANAAISSLQTNKLSASDIEGLYANIDFSNIGIAAIKELFSESGIIDNAVINNGKITGELSGVTINGDLITANTLVANKLIIQGENGLYYRLNYDGKNVTGTKTDYNSLDGTIIRAKTILANQINVSDLQAFGATIGGFIISNNSIYSAGKTSASNNTEGIYFDKDGQLVIGGSTNFLKYYKDQNNTFKLEIAADSLKFGLTNVETAINTAKTEAISAASSDATTKANNARTSAVNTAASDASIKAATAKSEAISTASSDATTKANNARTSAVSTAASDATTKANTAKSEAISTAAADATTKANNAAKTATNYLKFENNGLTIGNLTAGVLGENVLIDTDSVNIKEGSTVLASFKSNLIELGKNSTSSKISLCGNKGTIEFNGADNYLDIKGSTLRLNATGSAALFSTYASGSVGRKSVINLSSQLIDIYTQDSSNLVDGVGIWRTSQVQVKPDQLYALTDDISLYGRYGITIETISGNVDINTTNIKSTRSLKVLWSGAQYMFSGQSASLSEPVSAQLTGIVLHWQQYSSGSAQNAHHVYSFVPKSHVVLSPGGGVGFFLTNATGAYVGTKYIYVNNSSLAGHEANDDNTTAVDGGITTKNNFWVLTQVLGV